LRTVHVCLPMWKFKRGHKTTQSVPPGLRGAELH